MQMDTIQELIRRYDADKSPETYRQITERLKSEPTIWAAYSPAAGNYYLNFENGVPSAYIFTEKGFYDVFQDYLMQQNVVVRSMESSAQYRTLFFADLYRSGIERVVVDNGQTFLALDLFDLMEKPDFSDLPEVSRPVMNPELVKTAGWFLQELSAKRATKQMQNDMFRMIYGAKFLLPVDASKMNVEKQENGSAVVKENSIMSIPMLENGAGKHFYPFFTDWNEMMKYDKEHKYSGMIGRFEDMKHFGAQADGIVINPFGVNIALSPDMLKDVEDAGTGKTTPKVQEQEVKKDTEVLLGDPKVYPQRMADEIAKYLKTQKNVNAAYLRQMVKDNEKSYLIVVDFTGDHRTVFDGIAGAGVPYAEGMPLDFVPLSEEFGRSAIENVQPFYKKKKGIFG